MKQVLICLTIVSMLPFVLTGLLIAVTVHGVEMGMGLFETWVGDWD